MISRLRTLLFWFHLSIGVGAGLFILNMAMSGICIAYDHTITAWAESGQRRVSIPAAASRLDVETLIARIQVARPDTRFARLTVFSNPAAAAQFSVDKSPQILLVNPYTGEIMGEGQKTLRAFFSFMTGWHRWLATEGPARPVGKAITGAACLAYFILLLVGLVLWLPRPLSQLTLRRQMKFNPKLKGPARDWNWHNAIGFWSSPILLIVTITGLIMSYDWANNLLFRAVGSAPPERRQLANEGRGAKPEAAVGRISLEGLDKVWAAAEARAGTWVSLTLQLSPSLKAPAQFIISRGEGIARPDLTDRLTLDRATGEIIRSQPFAAQSLGQQLRSWAHPVHTGEALGLFGQTLAVLAAVGGGVLVWTGLALSCRRFFGRGKISRILVATSTPSSISS